MTADRNERARKALHASRGLGVEDYPPELQGDNYHENRRDPGPERNGHYETNGAGPEEKPGPTFPAPKPASQLQRSQGQEWLWHGYLAPGSVTLFSALWKAGKTTLLAHLLRAFKEGGDFCGRPLHPARILYVTEESEHRWAVRRDQLGLEDHISFLIRPFRGRPDWSAWSDFTLYLLEQIKENPVELVVLDPLVNLWPVRDENDNAQVLSALLPLQQLATHPGVLLVHHHRKGDGQEGTASRGAGSLMGFVDTIIELRRYNAGDREDRKRVLTAYGRDEDTPEELVVELGDEGYQCHGSRSEVSMMDLLPLLAGMLPAESPGWTRKEVLDNWPEDRVRPAADRLLKALHKGVDMGHWTKEGDGRRGSPWRFWRPS